MRFGRLALAAVALAFVGTCAAPSTEVAHAAPAAMSADITVTSFTPTILTPDGTLTISGQIRNTGTAPIAKAEVDLQLSDTAGAITQRQLLTAWQADSTIDNWGWTARAVQLAQPVEPGEAEPFSLQIDANQLPMAKGQHSGAFPCRIDLATASGLIAVDRTFIVWQPTTDIAPVTISTMLPLLAAQKPADPGAAPTGLTDPASIQAATSLLAQGADSPVDWLVDPALLQGAAKDGNTAALVAQLAKVASNRDVYRLPWGDADVTALAAAHSQSLYDAAVSSSAATFAAHKLASKGLMVWPPLGRIDATSVALVAGGGAQAIALASAPLEAEAPIVAGTSARTQVTAPGASVAGLVSDDTMTALMTQSDASDPLARQRIVAELATIAAQNPGHAKSLLLLPDRAWSDHYAQLESNLRVVGALPWVRMAHTSQLLQEPAEGATEAGPSVTSGGAMPVSLTDQLEQAYARAAAYSSVTDEPAATLAPLAHRLLFPLSVAARDQPNAREEGALASIDAVDRVTDTISVKQGSDINLIASSGMMPVAVTNSGTQPVTVTVKLESPDRRLIVNETKVLSVGPGSEERAQLKVEAVASGDVTLEVLALNRHGVEVAPRSTVTVRVRADWEDVGTLVVGLLFAALLIVGLFRSRRRKRAEREKAQA